MKQISSGTNEVEVVEKHAPPNKSLVRLILLFEQLNEGEKQIVRRHVNGEMPFAAVEDDDQLISTAATARMLQVSSAIVRKLIKEGRLKPDQTIVKGYPGQTILRQFRLGKVKRFIETNGLGRALWDPRFSAHLEKFEEPVAWEKVGKKPLDYILLLRKFKWIWKKRSYLNYLPLEEIVPILNEGLNSLAGRDAFVMQGVLRGFSFQGLAEMVGMKKERIGTYFNEALDKIGCGITGAKLKLIRDKFDKDFGHDWSSGPKRSFKCRLCQLITSERESLICSAQTTLPSKLSIFDLVTQVQLDAMKLTFTEAGLSKRITEVMAAYGDQQLYVGYCRIYDIADYLERHQPGGYALREVVAIYQKLNIDLPHMHTILSVVSC